jgi:oxalate decarboxylase
MLPATAAGGRLTTTAIAQAQSGDATPDVGAGDLWFFPSGTRHSIQGLGSDGCEFLLVFDDGVNEDNTFQMNDWFKHTPNEVLGKNFGAPAELFDHIPAESERFIFAAPLPASPSTYAAK